MDILKIGMSHTSECDVTLEKSALYLGSGDMEVFATPALVALMENAAMLCLAATLEAGQTSVGIDISTTHIKATPIGKRVWAKATVTNIDGRKVSFEIVAEDDMGVIGNARHDRFIVDREKFLSKLK